MKQIQKISVCGLGKLGACIAATLAARGFDVLRVDIDPEKVRCVNEGLPPVDEPLLARMSIISAELTKISVNSFITMKISFTNQLRMIAEQFPKADIHTILDAIGSDSRIGQKYLKAGLSFGGPCFPRDNRLLAYTAKQAGVEAPLAEATDTVNQETNLDLVKKVQAQVNPKGTIAVLGIAYKPDTYITEESAGLFLAQHLKRHGYRVLVHDFGAKPANAPALHEFEYIADPATLEQRDDIKVAVICCPWPQYRSVKFAGGTTVFTLWKI